MIPTGAIYKGLEGRTYFAAYNYNRDIYERPDEEIAKNPTFVSHIEYSYGGKNGSVNTYRVDEEISNIKDFSKINKIIEHKGDQIIVNNFNPRNIFQLSLKPIVEIINFYNISGKILNLPEKQRGEIIDLNLADIIAFCENKPAKKNENQIIQIVNEITPLTKAEFYKPERLVTTGKQEFVNPCLFFANFDPTGKGCPAAIFPGKKSSFDGQYFYDYFFFPSGECKYPCYADRKHRNPFKNIFKLNSEQLEEELTGGMILNLETGETFGKKVKYLHFGKGVDSYGFYAEENLTQALEVCAKVGTVPIIITKFMPYKKEFAELIKKSKGVLHYSISLRDDLEQGAFVNGASNNWRIEQAEKYKEDGVNTGYFLTIIGDANKIPIEQINFLKRAKFKKIKTTLHPYNFKRKEGALLTTGKTWEDLKRNKNYYFANGSGLVLRHQAINPEYYNLIEGGGLVSMCHHDLDKTFCSGCGLRENIVQKTIKPTKLFFRKSRRFVDPSQQKLNLE